MPMDPFFSGSNKKHYVPIPGVTEEYNRIMALPKPEAIEAVKALRDKYRRHEATPAECVIYRKVAFTLCHFKRSKIRQKDQKDHARNSERFRKARAKGRTVIVSGGFNTSHS